ncbi:MAG: DPP IV N-terminal domain-containing protein [Bacteroidaceae bacterium]|nr:DPP IV N-terminal domain-containing protein [Bacteroidaceae bacterium]
MKKLSLVLITFVTALNLTAQEKVLTIDRIIGGEFSARGSIAATPLADGEHYLTGSGANLILKRSFKTGAVVDTILNLQEAKGEHPDRFEGFILSPTEDMILLQTNSQKIFRRSFTAEYYIFNIRNNRIEPLSQGGPQQVPAFSPDGHNIAFVRDNNIFLVKLLFNNAEVKVTKDGLPGKIRNGIPDWAYEEEFGFTRAFDFSADSRMIAWIRFDESDVESYSLPFFLTSSDNSAYSQKLLEYRPQQYPTAGAANSKVSVHSFDISSSVIRDMDLKLDSTDYIPRIKFVENKDNNLFIFTLNRRQNKLEIYSANPRSTICNMILREEESTYIDEFVYMDAQFFGDRFIMQSERDGHRHLYLYDLSGRLQRRITEGNYEVLALHGYDSKTGTVFYESNETGIYDCAVWKIDGKGKKTRLTQEKGTSHARFSNGCKYFLNSWSDMETPPRITLMDAGGKTLKTLEDNASLAGAVKALDFPKKEQFSFTTVDGTTLYGWMVRPSGSNTPCPLILYQYSGPGSNEAICEWGAGFYPGGVFEALLTKKGYAVAVVDGRGTGRRGAEFKKQTYKRLGVLESQDQVAAAKYLGSLPYIDSDRIAIWGWSYGGYNTLMSMSEGSPVFRCGVAVAPVTDWRYYDAPYTERFMQQPKENPDGYREASAMERIGKLHGKLLIVHGLDDDNVFFSNTASYIEALINAGVDFDMQVYPGKEHSITGYSHRKHLFTRILRFFDENLK